MQEEEIIKLWLSGIDKNKLAEIYKRRYNHQISIVRLDIRNRHVRFITYKEALYVVERVILKQVGGTKECQNRKEF